MKLIIRTAEGKRAFAWESYALVRDNVQHFIEYGRPNGRFPALHAIETAVDTGSCVADSARLRGEVLRALAALQRVSIDDAALSARTRAVMIGSRRAPTAHPTVEARESGWPLPVPSGSEGGVTVADAAVSFFEAVLSVTETAVDGEVVQIVRAGEGPPFACRGGLV